MTTGNTTSIQHRMKNSLCAGIAILMTAMLSGSFVASTAGLRWMGSDTVVNAPIATAARAAQVSSAAG